MNTPPSTFLDPPLVQTNQWGCPPSGTPSRLYLLGGAQKNWPNILDCVQTPKLGPKPSKAHLWHFLLSWEALQVHRVWMIAIHIFHALKVNWVGWHFTGQSTYSSPSEYRSLLTTKVVSGWACFPAGWSAGPVEWPGQIEGTTGHPRGLEVKVERSLSPSCAAQWMGSTAAQLRIDVSYINIYLLGCGEKIGLVL